MVKSVLLSALLIAALDVAICGTLLGGHDTFSLGGGGDDIVSAGSYGGSSLGGLDTGSTNVALDSAGADTSSLQSGGGGGGDYHQGTSVVGGGGQMQGQTLDLTQHGGSDGHGIFGGSFISAGVGGKSGQHAEEGGGGDGGLGAYAGASSYDVGSQGEISGVLSSSVNDFQIDALHYHH